MHWTGFVDDKEEDGLDLPLLQLPLKKFTASYLYDSTVASILKPSRHSLQYLKLKNIFESEVELFEIGSIKLKIFEADIIPISVAVKTIIASQVICIFYYFS